MTMLATGCFAAKTFSSSGTDCSKFKICVGVTDRQPYGTVAQSKNLQDHSRQVSALQQ
jgi:hypothetical protein